MSNQIFQTNKNIHGRHLFLIQIHKNPSGYEGDTVSGLFLFLALSCHKLFCGDKVMETAFFYF